MSTARYMRCDSTEPPHADIGQAGYSKAFHG
jgi:hypothetical protein